MSGLADLSPAQKKALGDFLIWLFIFAFALGALVGAVVTLVIT